MFQDDWHSLIRRVLLIAVSAFSLQAQPIRLPAVHGDRTITFRFRDPGAKEVYLAREGAEREAMERGQDGVWSLTIGPVAPDLYGYSFVADRAARVDPMNPLMKPNLLFTQSMVDVPDPSLPWEINEAPHGVVSHHFYKSGVVGDERDFFVYTPPGYDPRAAKRYPTLYLLHGFSDDASGWTAVGRANIILDNLIAQGKAAPMLVVMPLGYGAPEIVTRGFGAFRDADLRERNFDRFRRALLEEVIPQVESRYRVIQDRGSRAIAGLSMGGAESLLTGLNALDQFAWIGAFSSGGLTPDYSAEFPKLNESDNARIKLLWIACGVGDRLIEANRKLIVWLKSKQIKLTQVETPGMHTWMVWRRNLAQFAPLLFGS